MNKLVLLLCLIISESLWAQKSYECGGSKFISFGKFLEDHVSTIKSFETLPYADIEYFSVLNGLLLANTYTFAITFRASKEYKVKNRIDPNANYELYASFNRTSLEFNLTGKNLLCKEISLDMFNALISSYERLKENKVRDKLEKRKI